ncbi:MAG: adenosylcobinamide-GDP ribazoletransferase [Telmatospirillum sp.]|nr:adenosylcobinamide-GDP ribazoletransferase [Telmatospirillum sp.]
MTEAPPPPTATPAPGAFGELCLALGFLTRIPVPLAPTTAALPLAMSVRAFAPAGAVVGALGAGIYALVWFAGLPPILAALLGLAATIWTTGALHEDGLADFTDAAGARNVERRLAIMRDSRIGTFGVLALLLSLALRAVTLAALDDPATVAIAWIGAAAASRAAIAYPMYHLPFARSDGAAVRAGRPSAAHAAAALAIGLAFLLPLGIFGFGLALLSAGGVTLYTSALARRQLGGQTGDALGMVQQSVEIAVLIATLLATVLFEAHAWMD